MSFHLAHGTVVYRTTTLHGCKAITMIERCVQDRWELASVEFTDDVVRERLGAELADESSKFAGPPEDRSSGGPVERLAQLDSVIETTVAWLLTAPSTATPSWSGPAEEDD